MLCEWCGEEGAEETVDPYGAEIYDEIIYVVICPNCYSERAADI